MPSQRHHGFGEIGDIVDVLEAWETVAMTERYCGQTQWAAQFAVASELCGRGYRVTLSLGNHPDDDLTVTSPSGRRFGVDVKGLYQRNYWIVRKKDQRSSNLFYVFAHVPDAGLGPSKPNRFFIMDQETVNRLIDEHRVECPPSEKFREGVPWRRAEEHEDAWRILPA